MTTYSALAGTQGLLLKPCLGTVDSLELAGTPVDPAPPRPPMIMPIKNGQEVDSQY